MWVGNVVWGCFVCTSNFNRATESLLRQLMHICSHTVVSFPLTCCSFVSVSPSTSTSDNSAAKSKVCSLIVDEHAAKEVLMHVKAHFKDKVCVQLHLLGLLRLR